MITASENPFRTSRLLKLPAHWGELAPADILARWHAAGRRGALVGPHGTGKTSRLRALAALLRHEEWCIVWIQWHDDGTTSPVDWRAALAAADARTVVCLDGAENLGPLKSYHLYRYIRRAGGVLATRHRRAWLLPTVALHAPSQAIFVAHAEHLAPGSASSARAAFAAAGGNAHETFRRLYHDYSRLSSRPINAASASAGGFAA